MTRLLLLIAALASQAAAATSEYAERVWFRDGAALEIFTETASFTGVTAVEGRLGCNYGRAVRLVIDSADNILFAYIVDSRRDTPADTFVIRVRPLDARALAMIHEPVFGFGALETGIPTVPGVHEFRAVRAGEVVSLDIPYAAPNGEKIFDVLRPRSAARPHPSVEGGTVAAREQLSLKNISLQVDGQTISAPQSWMVGAAARIDVPGHGSYFLAAYQPAAGRAYVPNVVASGKSLSWSIDGDDIEITSQTDVLTRASDGRLGVFHDPDSHAQDAASAVVLQTADTVGPLAPR